ncbi:5-hydroxytryptamine receptor 5A [Biomphalaria pfeifferi]|uniref:5-hydroxytryptamine receptor 5A n=1 Tax=Biomphalaria pfeifferi TaxID=112525 RepID=A0AAD8C5W9_BIOPF|nr:5-hydroxytryptamine receptor 5A [Biomphalaria pfeifferi]
MDMANGSRCDNVSLNLSESSTRFTSHPYLLVVIVTVLCFLATFIIGANVLILGLLVHRRYRNKYVNRIKKQGNLSPIRLSLTISVSFLHLFVAVFCMPLTIVQVVNNGKWTLGSSLCRLRTYAEVLTEVVRIYHIVCLSFDFFLMLRFPMRHRMLSPSVGYRVLATVWAIPLVLFVVAVSLGWDTEGIEDALHCLNQYNMCLVVLSQKVVLLFFPIAIALTLFMMVGIAVILKSRKRPENRSEQNRPSELIPVDSEHPKVVINHNNTSSCVNDQLCETVDNQSNKRRLKTYGCSNQIDSLHYSVKLSVKSINTACNSSNIIGSTFRISECDLNSSNQIIIPSTTEVQTSDAIFTISKYKANDRLEEMTKKAHGPATITENVDLSLSKYKANDRLEEMTKRAHGPATITENVDLSLSKYKANDRLEEMTKRAHGPATITENVDLSLSKYKANDRLEEMTKRAHGPATITENVDLSLSKYKANDRLEEMTKRAHGPATITENVDLSLSKYKANDRLEEMTKRAHGPATITENVDLSLSKYKANDRLEEMTKRTHGPATITENVDLSLSKYKANDRLEEMTKRAHGPATITVNVDLSLSKYKANDRLEEMTKRAHGPATITENVDLSLSKYKANDSLEEITKRAHGPTTITENVDLSLPVKPNTKRNEKGLCFIITLTTTNGIYMIISLVFSALFAFNTSLFPLWFISLTFSMRYIHVASMPIYTLRLQYFRTLLWNMKNKCVSTCK